MTQTKDLFIEISQIKNLPPLPDESIRIVNAVNDPDIAVTDLVEVISLSPVIVARLLGLANSAFFGFPGKITDLRMAIIQVLGLNLVKSLALSIVLNVELTTSKCKSFDADYFWTHALITALFAQKLALKLDDDLLAPGTVYTAGLMLNIGLLAAVNVTPSGINEVLSQTDRIAGSVCGQMEKNFGLSQYDIGGILLQKWKLPEIYQTVVKDFRKQHPETQAYKLADLLELTHWVGAYIIMDKLQEMPDVSHLMNRLSLPDEVFENVVNDIESNKDNIKELAAIISG